MWNPKKPISDKYPCFGVLYFLELIDVSRSKTPTGDATFGQNAWNSVKMRNAYKQGS